MGLFRNNDVDPLEKMQLIRQRFLRETMLR